MGVRSKRARRELRSQSTARRASTRLGSILGPVQTTGTHSTRSASVPRIEQKTTWTVIC